MPLPPLPPLGEIVWWIIVLFVVVLVIAGIAWLVKYMVGGGIIPAFTPPERNQGRIEVVMQELLQEIRMLRREIAELRREMKE